MSQVRLVMAAKDQRGLMKTLLGVLIAMEMAPAPVTAQLLTVTNQPASLIERLGATAVFAVGVSGAGPFTYQRQRNGTKKLKLGRRKAEIEGRAKPPKATAKPYSRHILGIDSGLQSHHTATTQPHHSQHHSPTKATTQPHQSHTKATPKPHQSQLLRLFQRLEARKCF